MRPTTLCRAAAILALLGHAAGAAASGRPEAGHYASPPAISGVTVSPSGEHAALVWRVRDQPAVAAVIDLARPGEVKVVGGFPKSRVDSVGWVNDRRLHFFAADAEAAAVLVKEGDAGVFAVDRDGSNLTQLIDWRWRNDETASRIRSRILPYGWSIRQSLDDGSADVMVVQRASDLDNDALPPKLARLNTLDGTLRMMNRNAPDGADDWLIDAAGEPRVVSVERDGRGKVYWRAPGTETWALLQDEPALSNQRIFPLALEADGTLVVATQRGGDTMALYGYQPAKRALDAEPIVALKGFDVSATIETDTRSRRVVGLHTTADRWLSVWFDERLAQVQQIVDKSLPAGRTNVLLCGRCETVQRFVVHSWSDRHPGEYYVYDHAQRALQRIGERRPWLPEATQGRRSFHRVAARDGLPLPVVVTHPAGAAEPAKPLPAVVLVHGGPWLRGSNLGWDAEAQFFASRGWRVLQVEFRGSTGFGERHFRAGWKQWGLAMQDDLADAVAWAAQQGLVDAQRVCIVGASYGGYAALMGAARHPQTYRCAASHVGVTELDLMFSSRWNDISGQDKRHSLPALLGDPKADAEQLRQTSPLHRVKDIRIPIFLAQGTLDRRVPKENADRFERAARAAGVQVERVDYPEEGHSFVQSANAADHLRRLEAFLAKSLDAPR